ncbi:hypothetical protein N7470_008342 [Penicillium chermesinum]|nr:hypothetical protein N7470_008342 [Penicillium chermesinum]
MSREEHGDPLPLRIASLVHAHFNALPAKSKPHILSDGSKEWIPMTGIVAVRGEGTSSESLHCIAVTSGAKCLSASQIPRCRGLVLHDCHAEILAIRAFNHWLMTECHSILAEEAAGETNPATGSPNPSESKFIRKRDHHVTCEGQCPPFEMQPNVRIYMYCTCAPCGDGSMELCMAAQEDATPWEVVRQNNSGTENSLGDDNLLDGRAHFSLLGVVRRKPARTDAESTRSKSCSDKLALRQVSSLLSWQTSRLLALTENAYLAGLILPEDEISRVACDRAFGKNGRMAALVAQSWPSSSCERSVEYRFRPFQVLSVPAGKVRAMWQFAKPKPTTIRQLADGEMAANGVTPRKSKPGNVSAVWTLAPSNTDKVLLPEKGSKSLPSLCGSKTGLYESIISGVKQGNKASSPTARGASALSRAKMWALLEKITDCEPSGEAEQKTAISSGLSSRSPLGQPRRPAIYDFIKRGPTDEGDSRAARKHAIRHAQEVLKGGHLTPGMKVGGWTF